MARSSSRRPARWIAAALALGLALALAGGVGDALTLVPWRAAPAPEPSPAPSPRQWPWSAPASVAETPEAAVWWPPAVPEVPELPEPPQLLARWLTIVTDREVPSVHPAIVPSARRFLKAYRAFTGRVTAPVRKALARAGDRQAKQKLPKGQVAPVEDPDRPVPAGPLTAIRRRMLAPHRGLYARAMDAADAHLKDFGAQVAPGLKERPTYLLVHRSECLAFLVESARNEVVAMFPIGVGLLDRQKARRGDRCSPYGPAGGTTRETTPFFVHPLVPQDPWPPGVITRGIGVASRDPRFDFLYGGWTIMFHGTPDAGSMGTNSSLGCFRMLPRHIELVFPHVREGAPIVVVP